VNAPTREARELGATLASLHNKEIKTGVAIDFSVDPAGQVQRDADEVYWIFERMQELRDHFGPQVDEAYAAGHDETIDFSLRLDETEFGT
jgi:hypothetical protein